MGMSRYREIVLEQPCPWCDAEPGEPCRTPRGKKTYAHSLRSGVVIDAWGAGYQDAEDDLYDSYVHNSEWFDRHARRHVARMEA